MRIINKVPNAEMVGTSIAGKEIELKGESALVLDKEPPWQRILLWLVLIIGVYAIVIMVVRLSKQMKTHM